MPVGFFPTIKFNWINSQKTIVALYKKNHVNQTVLFERGAKNGVDKHPKCCVYQKQRYHGLHTASKSFSGDKPQCFCVWQTDFLVCCSTQIFTASINHLWKWAEKFSVYQHRILLVDQHNTFIPLFAALLPSETSQHQRSRAREPLTSWCLLATGFSIPSLAVGHSSCIWPFQLALRHL